MSSWFVPSQDDVARTLSAAGEPTLRRLFFHELENPEWLTPLRNLGAFVDPGVLDAGDGPKPWPWPEGEYLARVARAEPVIVAQIFKEVGDSENPWVRVAMVNVALVIPIDELLKFFPSVMRAVTHHADTLDPTAIGMIAERLIDASRVNEAQKLLTAMFRPSEGTEEETAFGSQRSISSTLGDFWYRELLTRLTPKIAHLGLKGLKLAVGWLIRAAELRGDDGSAGSSVIYRPAIAPHEQNEGLYEIDDALIDSVRDIALSVTQTLDTREPIDFLNARESLLLRRIGMYVAASAFTTGDNEVRSAGWDLIRDATLLDSEARPEYVRLAEIVLPSLNEAQVDEFADFVQAGSWLPPEATLRRLAAFLYDDPDAVNQDAVEAQKRRLTHRLLSGFGGALRGPLAGTLEVLKAEFGEIQHPEFSTYTESFVGPVSPVTVEQLASMESSAVADYLRTWAPEPSDHFGPSIDGLARVVENVASQDPERFEALHNSLLSLRPQYVRSILFGWTQAVREGHELDGSVWSSLARLARHSPEEGDEGSVDYESDPRWKWAHGALAGLITAVVDKHAGEVLALAWSVLEPLLEHSDPTPAHEEQYGGSNMDPLTLSLNTVRPEALRSSFHLLTALTTDDGNETVAIIPDVLVGIGRHVGVSRDPSLAVAAVIGEGIGRVWNVDKAWVESRAVELFTQVASVDDSERAWADVVVSVALRVYGPGPATLAMLRPAFEAIFTAQYMGQRHIEGWRAQRSTVETAAFHLLWNVALGVLDKDDPLVQAVFESSAGPDVAAEALGRIGWQLMQSSRADGRESPPETFIDRSKGLVEYRLAAARAGTGSYDELHKFHWWIRSDAFDVEWWLPILDEISAAGVDVDKSFVGDALEEAASRNPSGAVLVLERLLAQTNYWRRYALLQHASAILTEALKSGQPDAEARARSVMDLLAREGHIDVIDSIERLMGNPGQ